MHEKPPDVKQPQPWFPCLVRACAGINWPAFDYYPSLRRIGRYTEEHYSEDLPLQTAARIAGMEATYFSSFFRKKTGIRYTDWVHLVRISRAMDRLVQRDEPVTRTAFAVGFADVRTFERVFKRITRMTARDFKKIFRPA